MTVEETEGAEVAVHVRVVGGGAGRDPPRVGGGEPLVLALHHLSAVRHAERGVAHGVRGVPSGGVGILTSGGHRDARGGTPRGTGTGRRRTRGLTSARRKRTAQRRHDRIRSTGGANAATSAGRKSIEDRGAPRGDPTSIRITRSSGRARVVVRERRQRALGALQPSPPGAGLSLSEGAGRGLVFPGFSEPTQTGSSGIVVREKGAQTDKK